MVVSNQNIKKWFCTKWILLFKEIDLFFS
jgi:hypothetical protein